MNANVECEGGIIVHLGGMTILNNCTFLGDLFSFFGRENFYFLMKLLKRLNDRT